MKIIGFGASGRTTDMAGRRTDIPCPDPAEWADLIDDATPKARAAQLERHLDLCDPCFHAFERLSGESSSSMREAVLKPEVIAPYQEEVDRIIHRVLHATTLAALPSLDSGVAPYTLNWSPEKAFLEQTPYIELSRVGSGGMGVVYKARHKELDIHVAIKILTPRAGLRADASEILGREARLLAELWSEPSIIQVRGWSTIEGHAYFVMEFLEGPSLEEYLPEKAGNQVFAVELIKTIARGVHEAHEKGVVHRDLKPSNIQFDRKGKPKILDFGIALLCDAPDSPRDEQIIGTPAYMAPEQWDPGLGPIDRRTDIYALGCILYELLTGRPPFPPLRNLPQLREMVLTKTPDRPVPPNAPISRDLQAICLRCLAKRPSDRYATALDLWKDLERYEKKFPVSARKLGPIGHLGYFARRRPVVSTVTISILVISALVAAFIFERLAWQAYSEAQDHLEAGRVVEAVDGMDRAARYSTLLPYAPADFYRRNAEEWRPLIRRRLAEFDNDAVVTVAVGSPVDRLIAIGDEAGKILLWYPDRDDEPKSLTLPGLGPIRTLTFSPSGKRLVATERKTNRAVVINVDEARIDRSITMKSVITSAVVLDDGGVFTTCLSPEVWFAPPGQDLPRKFSEEVELRRRTKPEPPEPMVFNAVALRVVLGGGVSPHLLIHRANDCVLWDLNLKRIVRTFVPGKNAGECMIRFSDDGSELLAYTSKSISIFDTASGELKQALNDPPIPAISSLRFPRSSSYTFLTGGGEAVDLWRGEGRLGAWRDLHEDLAVKGTTCDLGVFQDSVLSGLSTPNLVLWRIAASGISAPDLGPERGVSYSVFARDTNILAVAAKGSYAVTRAGTEAGKHQHILLLDPATGREILSVPDFGPDRYTNEVSVDGSARKVAAVVHGSGSVQEIRTGEVDNDRGFVWKTLPMSARSITSVRMHPDGKSVFALVVGENEASAKLNKISLTDDSSMEISLESSFARMVLSSDGSRVALGDDLGLVQVVSADDLRGISRFKVNLGRINTLAFSGDSTRLALGFTQGTITVHDLTRPDPAVDFKRIQSEAASILALRFSPDNESIWVIHNNADDWLKQYDLGGRGRIGPRRSLGYRPIAADFSRDLDWIALDGGEGRLTITRRVREVEAPPVEE